MTRLATSSLSLLRASSNRALSSTSTNAARASSLSLFTAARSAAPKAASRQTSFRAAPFSTSAANMAGGSGLGESNVRPDPDQVVQDIADYVHNFEITSETAWNTARLCLMDSLGCHMEALRYPGARAVLGPVVPGTVVPNGAKVPGTNYQLDPIRAAFNNGALIRWLDFNDTWLAAEWGHPSDNIGSILAVTDWLSRTAVAEGKAPLKVKDILEGAIKAHEIQGNLAIKNSFNRVGLDHVVLVKVASTAVVSKLLGNTRDQTVDAISQAFVDGQSLRTYRHAPNAGSRKSWAAGDACSRAVNLALLVQKGEMGYNSVLTAKTWGFYDVLFKGKAFEFERGYGSYVMENVLFKLVPAEFHAQTAVEASIILNKKFSEAGKTAKDISKIKILTQDSAIRIISKAGHLANYADRDHSLQYMAALGLLFGKCEPHMYGDDFAAEHGAAIDSLREKMWVEEDAGYTETYLDPSKRTIGNSVELEFNDGSKLGPVALEYPVGHRARREESIPLIKKKLGVHLEGQFDEAKKQELLSLIDDHEKLISLDAHKFVDLWVKN